MVRMLFAVLCALLVTTAASTSARAQNEDTKPGWEFETELSGIWTAGNSESNTFGLEAMLRRNWRKSKLTLRGGGTQTQSTLSTRTATGTADDFTVTKDSRTEKTAELFFARGLYEYDISQRFFAFGGADWLRNTFAGIDSRTLIALGAGNTWKDNDSIRFKTSYSATYTFQSDVVENPFTNHNFPGVRFTYDFWVQATTSTQFESLFILDWNLDNTEDVRIDFTNSLPIAISETLFFKPSLQLLWRNEPSLTTVPLVDGSGVETGESVVAPLEKLDSVFSVSLVVRM